MPLPAFENLVPRGVRMRVIKDPFGDPEWWNGRLLVWELPDRSGSYGIGVDTGEGVGGDRSIASVVRVGVGGRADRQVAEFASNEHGPAAMAPIVAALGRFYSDAENEEALVTAEANSLGQIFLQDLRTIHNYTNIYLRRQYDRFDQVWINKLGFYTNKETRRALISRGLHALHEGALIPANELLIDEMEDFEGDWNMAIAKAKTGHHDDRIMAFFMAYWGLHEEDWASGNDPVDERNRLTAAGKLQDAAAARDRRKPDYQNTACTYEDMVARADEEIFG